MVGNWGKIDLWIFPLVYLKLLSCVPEIYSHVSSVQNNEVGQREGMTWDAFATRASSDAQRGLLWEWSLRVVPNWSSEAEPLCSLINWSLDMAAFQSGCDLGWGGSLCLTTFPQRASAEAPGSWPVGPDCGNWQEAGQRTSHPRRVSLSWIPPGPRWYQEVNPCGEDFDGWWEVKRHQQIKPLPSFSLWIVSETEWCAALNAKVWLALAWWHPLACGLLPSLPHFPFLLFTPWECTLALTSAPYLLC